MAPHSSTLAWKIPWTDKPVRLQSMGSLRVGRDCLGHTAGFEYDLPVTSVIPVKEATCG